MSKEKKRKLSGAKLILAPTVSSSLAAIQEFLKGVEIKMNIDGKPSKGYIHNLDFGPGSDWVFASVAVTDPDDPEHTIYVRVSVGKDGVVTIMPNQPDED